MHVISSVFRWTIIAAMAWALVAGQSNMAVAEESPAADPDWFTAGVGALLALETEARHDPAAAPEALHYQPPAEAFPFLRAVAADESRDVMERAAALVFLAPARDSDRERDFLATTTAIENVVRPKHVHFLGDYLEAMVARRESMNLTADDVPLLARLGLVDGNGVAVLALQYIDAPESLLVALAAWRVNAGMTADGELALWVIRALVKARPEFADVLHEHANRAGNLSASTGTLAALGLLAAGDVRAAGPMEAFLTQWAERDIPRAVVFHGELWNWLYENPDPAYVKPVQRLFELNRIGPAQAAAILKQCKAALSREALWARLLATDEYSTAQELTRLLDETRQEEDDARLAGMLAPEYWKNDAFYVRLNWLATLDPKWQTDTVRAALWQIVETKPPVFHAGGAIRCLARRRLPGDAERVAAMLDAGKEIGVAAAGYLVTGAPDPHARMTELLQSDSRLTRKHAARFIEMAMSNRERVTGLETPEQRTAILPILLAAADGETDAAAAVQHWRTLWTLISGTNCWQALTLTDAEMEALAAVASRVLDAAPDAVIREAMIPALAVVPHAETTVVLERLAADEAATVRERAQWALKQRNETKERKSSEK